MKYRLGLFVSIGLVIVLCSTVLAIKIIYHFADLYSSHQRYPSFEKNTQDYHSTQEIHEQLIEDNGLNPFYTSFDLTPTIENPKGKLYAYGPLAEPLEKSIRILVVCGQHGRELVSSEFCLALIRLLQLYIRDNNFTESVGHLKERNVGIWIIPVANPWARQIVENTDLVERKCQRTNANGVDLNRNYPSFEGIEVGGGERERREGKDEEYPGPNPLSEYESIAIAEFIEYSRPHLLINIHSGAHDILLPYDYSSTTLPKHYRTMVKLANYARTISCPTCGLGPSSLLLYPSKGTLVDYAMLYNDVQLAYTWEIYQSPNIINDHILNSSECLEYFNPKAGKELFKTLEKWTTFFFALLEKLYSEIKS